MSPTFKLSLAILLLCICKLYWKKRSSYQYNNNFKNFFSKNINEFFQQFLAFSNVDAASQCYSCLACTGKAFTYVSYFLSYHIYYLKKLWY